MTAIRELCTFDGSISESAEKNELDNHGKRQGHDLFDVHADNEKQQESPTADNGDLHSRRTVMRDRQLSWKDLRFRPKAQLAPEQRRSLKGLNSPGLSSARRGNRRSSLIELNEEERKNPRLGSLSALPRPSMIRSESKRGMIQLDRADSMGSGPDIRASIAIPYLDKICWACDELDYPREYADLVGSQFLGLDTKHPVTHINGHVPQVAELVEFVAQAFMRITDFADLILVFIDDFQWVDSFTWKVIRALGQSGKKMLLICAMRSHDKQAMRRISTAVNFRLEITLGPLDLPEIKELTSSVLGCSEDAIDEELCTDLYQRTGGLPVYVVELLEAVKRNKTASENEQGKLRLAADDQLMDVSRRCRKEHSIYYIIFLCPHNFLE